MAAERASIGQFLCTLPTPYGNRILLACHTFLRPVQTPTRQPTQTLVFRHRSLCRHHLRGIADREVIAFPAHFEVALVKADDRRAMADGHDRRLR